MLARKDKWVQGSRMTNCQYKVSKSFIAFASQICVSDMLGQKTEDGCSNVTDTVLGIYSGSQLCLSFILYGKLFV